VRLQSQSSRISTTANAKPDHTPSLLNVPMAEVKLSGWASTVVHTSGELKFTVIHVVPGGEIPTHYHREVWDYFMPLQGEGVIEVTTESGRIEEYCMSMHSFLAMPPKVIHRVCNKSSEAQVVPGQSMTFIEQ
jgi:mannose-6-phosphate isomerase-like protein (cupin superfamily)